MMLTKDVNLNGERKSLFETWTTYTNLRAILNNVGQPSSLHYEFKPFTVDELRQHIVLCVFHSVSPSPRVEMKFRDQRKDPANGNDFSSKVFSKNAERRHKHFKCFFALADPRHNVPSKRTQPNYKVDEFFSHFNEASLAACDPGLNLSTDEQDQRLTGKGEGTVRCKFKREGDGYFMNSTYERGCTLTFCPRNQPLLVLFVINNEDAST